MKPYSLCFIFSDVNSSKTLEYLVLQASKEYRCKVYIFGSEDNLLKKRLQESNIDVHLMINHGTRFSFFIFCLRLMYIALKEKCLFFTSGLLATYALLVLKILRFKFPWIFIRHHSDAHLGKPIFRKLDKLSASKANRVISVSKIVSRLLVSEGLDPTKVEMVHNGIILPKIKPSFSGISLRSSFRVGLVSRVEPLKGLEFVLEALIKISNQISFEIWHVGEIGGSSERYRELIQHESINSRYKHFPWQEDLSWFYSSIDCFIHAPITDTAESFGMVYLEGLASDALCIFTKSGILNEISHSNEGFWVEVPHRDSSSIASAILSVSGSHSYRGNTHKRHLLLEGFSLKKTIDSYQRLIRSEIQKSMNSS